MFNTVDPAANVDTAGVTTSGDATYVYADAAAAGTAGNPVSDLEEKLIRLISRRHPEYNENIEHWEFLEETYEGGREWFEKNIHKYFKEGENEFKQRKCRAYRFNHTREVVDLIQKYIFKSVVSRKEDAPDVVKAFWDEATLSDLNIDQFMNLVSKYTSIYGGIWIFLDTTKTGEIQTKAQEKEQAQIYAYIKTPEDVLDVSLDDNGNVNWILTREKFRDDADPINSTGLVMEQFRLTMKDRYMVIRKIPEANNKFKVVLVDMGLNSMGFVPAFYATHLPTDEVFDAPGLIDDIAYQDKAVANYLSNLDAIIQDQTFSQLAMPAQSVMPEGTSTDQLKEMGTKRVFLYDSEGGEPKYLSPDPKQAGVILQVVNKIIGEIYHTIGMAGERTKSDNAVGIDNSSGVAKAYDFERVNALLAAKAQSLQIIENRMIEMVLMIAGEDNDNDTTTDDEYVTYPSTFDVRSVYDEFTIAEKLVLIEAPDSVRREQMDQVIDKLFPYLDDVKLKQMKDELKDWPPPPVDPAAQGGLGANNKTLSMKPLKLNRQGEVTKATK